MGGGQRALPQAIGQRSKIRKGGGASGERKGTGLLQVGSRFTSNQRDELPQRKRIVVSEKGLNEFLILQQVEIGFSDSTKLSSDVLFNRPFTPPPKKTES